MQNLPLNSSRQQLATGKGKIPQELRLTSLVLAQGLNRGKMQIISGIRMMEESETL